MRREIPFVAVLTLFAVGIAVGQDVAVSKGDAVKTPEAGAAAPILLVIQGKLKEGGEATYAEYLKGTGPLMAEYGVTVDAVGAGVAGDHTTDAWPVNAVLRFPDLDTAEAFLADPRYIEIKEKYRDAAYEELHLSFVQTRPPRVRTAKAVAEEAFADLEHGLATGEWQPFLDRLSDDFTFHFPMGRYQGLHRGKDKAAEFFAYVSQAYADGLFIDEVLGVTAEGTRVVFEFADHGLLFGKPYAGRIAISLDVRGEKICGYREYFGLVGPPPGEGGGS
ncbi:MAG: nuclear transport factor 2 family protein [Candidatus Sulfomarinibacteraceae bacterium]